MVDSEAKKYEEAISLLAEIAAENRIASRKPKYANPAAVGLAGFGLTTLVLQFHNIGWMESVGPVIWLGLIFGGICQVIAGLQEYGNGNNFGYSAFTTYGAFWISLAVMLIANKLNFYPTMKEDMGYFLIAFTLYTFIVWIASWCVSIVLCIVFFLLLLGFILLDVEHFVSDHPVAENFKRAAGWVLLFCALGAWYCMAHVIYKDMFAADIVPVGPAPMTLIKKRFCRADNMQLLRTQTETSENL